MARGGLVAEKLVIKVWQVRDDRADPGEMQVDEYLIFEAATTLST